MPRTVAQTGEFSLIGEVVARLPQGPAVLLGPGDDAAVIAAPDARVVASTDLLVEGRHFRRDLSTACDVGHKAAAANLADIAAMGAVPTALLVGLAAPPGLEAAWALELADGLREECARVGASVAGGDTVSSDTLTIAVTALGDLRGRAPVTRAGARPGDVVAVAGRLGWSAAGLAALLAARRAAAGPHGADAWYAEAAPYIAVHRRPAPPYAAGPQAAAAGATAMIDTSDGLLADLGHLAVAAGVRMDIDTAALEVPDLMRRLAGRLGADPLDWVLRGGEDHSLAAAFPPGTSLEPPWRVIGTVSSGDGVTVDGAPFTGPPGWDHFR